MRFCQFVAAFVFFISTVFAGTIPRVPAEFEPHGATWLQWPNKYEKKLRPAFARIIRVVLRYEKVHLVVGSQQEQAEARRFLAQQKVNSKKIIWHIYKTDNSWLRDNGPVYVEHGGKLQLLDFKFDAWGGNFGADVTFTFDDVMPQNMARLLSLKVVDYGQYVLERGNLEFNGEGILLINWHCQKARNPGLSKAQHEKILTKAFGLKKIIWAYGYDQADLTTGHIDGMARFISRDTVAIIDTGEKNIKRLARDVRAAGLKVKWYEGDVNWLVGNGFVLAMQARNQKQNKRLRRQLAGYFPRRKVYLIDAFAIAEAGGGIHCVTNDQPALSR